MSKPCEYCGCDLPLGVDKRTRQIRSFHFQRCEKRPSPCSVPGLCSAMNRKCDQCDPLPQPKGNDMS
ncbi:MAG: hypothetical protein VKL39_13735, partial [Leptolyngbyaceae bacterium]|nr:hypothetical protein [Leptolyngbyaceae bacterium]